MSDSYTYDEIAEEKPTFEDALAALAEDRENLPGPVVLYGLSDLTETQLAQLEPVWRKLDLAYQRILMQMLVDVSEQNFELNYDALGYANLEAAEAKIRQAAIELLWEDNSLYLMYRFIELARTDPDVDVRVEAIKALGRFILMGELGDIGEHETAKAQKTLLAFIHDDDENNAVRRYALESLANCSRAELVPLIQTAYRSQQVLMRQSAVVAMGRTCDADAWSSQVLEELESDDPDMRHAAVRAAGELQLEDAVPEIVRILAEADRVTQETAIWSLGEIGGKQATQTLETLASGAEEVGDDALVVLIEDAIANAALASGDLMMIDFNEFDD